MATRRSALGRGLGALIPGAPGSSRQTAPPAGPDTPAAGAPAYHETRSGAPAEIPVSSIDPNPEQPRRHFDEEELARLAESIRRHGILQPVVVRRAGDRYELVVGERRWRAAQLAGRETVPAVIADVAPRDRLEVALVENVQRHDLNPIELAQAFRALAESGATQEQIGARVGVDRSHVANHLRLLELPREIQADVEEGRLTFGHARALLSVKHPEQRYRLRDRILREGLAVREVEAAARAASGERRKRQGRRTRDEPGLDADTRRLLDALRDRLKTRVRLQGSASRGRLEIEFYGPEELHRISETILGGLG